MEIEKIVTTKYKVDGIVFDNYEQAEKWKQYIEARKEQSFFKMYDSEGEVDHARFASFVYLKGMGAAEKFIDQAEGDNSEYDGIHEEDTGFFFWNNWNDEYQKIDPDTLCAAYKIYKEYIQEKE